MSSYNGWTNYETWNVKLWIDNDQGEQEYWLEQARDNDVSDLANILKNSYEESMPELSGVYADLMSAALSSVNWREIAESLLGDAAELVEDDEEEAES